MRIMGHHTLGFVHTTLEEFEKAALFLRFGLPSTLIRHENAAIQPLEFENASCAFYCGRKTVTFWKKTELFKNDDVTIIT